MSERYVVGPDRMQELILPDRIDGYVDEDNEVRFIDAFVDTLDLARIGFTHSEPNEEGRPAYDPRDLLKLYVWGYLNQVRSSRKLERECCRDMEVMWLMRKLAPDFWTISEFRKQNVDRIKGVFREFVSFLQEIDLVEGKLASLDGSKIKACNARKRTFTKENLDSRLKRIEERIEKYMKELETNDADDKTEGEERELASRRRSEYLKAKLERLKRSRKELAEVGRMMKELHKDEVSLTDPESRLMKNNGKIEVCYNSELSVDSKEHIIVNYDVTNEANDANQLAPMAKETKEALHLEKLDVTADSGFVDMEQIEDCLKNGVTPYLPGAALDGSAGQGRVPDPNLFGKDKFTYDGKRDVYVCPAGKELKFWYASPYNKAGKILRRYATDACSACPFKARCTSGKRGRIVSRWEHQEIVDELLTKVRLEPEKLEARAKLAEHPFGTIKRAFNQGYFLLKGSRKVKGEMGFTALAYDIRRALNILGTKTLTALIRTR